MLSFGNNFGLFLKVLLLDENGNVLGSADNPVRIDPTGTTVQPVSGGGGGGGNAAAGLTGAAVPTSADYQGVNIGGNLTGVTGLSLGSAVAPTVAIVDASGNQITSFGNSSSVGTNGAAIPGSSTQVGGSDGTNLQPLQVDASKNLKVIVNAALPAGSNVIGHVVIDSGSTTAVTGNVTVVQGTGTNLHTVIDSGTLTTVSTVTAVTAITNALPAGSNVIGHVVTDSGSTTAVTGNVTVVGTLTNNNAAPAGTNVGALTALANAANPSFTEGDQVLVSVDLSGHQRVVATGAAASGAAVAGNPILLAGKGSGNVDTLLTDGSGGLVAGGISVNAADGKANGIVSPISGSGSTIINQTYGYAFNGTTWDRARSAGVGNAVAATGLAAAVGYVQYNTTLPAPTAGQYTAAQCDTTGSTYVNIEGRKVTYSAFASFTAVAGDIAVLPGSASKTIRVIRVEISFTTSGTAAIEAVQLIVRSAADTGGTSAAMTAVPHDSNFAGASAAPLSYTVAPTPGAAVGTIRGVQFNDASSTLPGANSWIWDFGSRPSSAIVLRGVAQMICVNLPTAIATQTATVSFEWTEE